MILDEEPVAHIAAVAVDRQRLGFKRVQQHQRDQFFWKLVGPVVVRAIRDDRRQLIGFMPGANQMIGRGLRGRIGRIRRVRRWLGRRSGLAQCAVTSSVETCRKRKSRLVPSRSFARYPRETSSSVNAPTMLVSINGEGSSIERST